MQRELDDARDEQASPADADDDPKQVASARLVVQPVAFLLVQVRVRVAMEARPVDKECAADRQTDNSDSCEAQAKSIPVPRLAALNHRIVVADAERGGLAGLGRLGGF